ncbi:hypothetical protein [Raineyella sp. LH-20]|uniref:hypothetical protein n=1 Tax=Raineyella sp. LH-20 TaxID=3081204 RepID=UPI0029548723|nr:hypothetical protein [Raineyella sp. LH-20]WOP19892.1 hypothetical protein R0146_06355 [Raineyella sp. LH-20]
MVTSAGPAEAATAPDDAPIDVPDPAAAAVRATECPSHAVAAASTRPTPRRKGPLTALTGALGVVSGAAPHVLHHVTPLLGAALVAGAGGTILFAALGFAASVPFLLRLRRRFGTWWAPAVATVIYAVMFTASTLWVAPLINDVIRPDPTPPVPAISQADHAAHHPS